VLPGDLDEIPFKNYIREGIFMDFSFIDPIDYMIFEDVTREEKDNFDDWDNEDYVDSSDDDDW